MALTDCRGGQKFVQGNALTAEVNAGKIIVEPRKGKKIAVDGGFLRALGGNAQTATSVDITDTTGTPVVAVAGAVAGLTNGAVLDFRAAANVTLTTKLGDPLTADKGLQIIKSGSDLATATSVDYVVFYHYVDN
jgi:hypothetical protein